MKDFSIHQDRLEIREVAAMIKLDGFDGLGRPKESEGVQPGSGTSRTDPLAPQEPGDRVEFSELAKKVAALADKAAGLPDVRRDKVDAIRQELEDNIYQVDPRKLANAILEFEDVFKR